jgi:hypothetical protein
MKKLKAIHKDNLTAEERQSFLLRVSKDYMGGKMSRSQFQEAERQYGTDYSSVTLGLASKYQLLPRFWRFLTTAWRPDHEEKQIGIHNSR